MNNPETQSTTAMLASSETTAAETCPHSGLSIHFLKRIGKAVEKIGAETVKAAITVALSGKGAFSEE